MLTVADYVVVSSSALHWYLDPGHPDSALKVFCFHCIGRHPIVQGDDITIVTFDSGSMN